MSNLVTGGGGFLGRYIVEQLVARGEPVRVFCRHEPNGLTLDRVSWHRGDVRDVEAVAAACQGITTVFHCAAIPGIWGPWSHFHEVNTRGTLNLLSAARSVSATRFVYTSSPSVVFDGSDHLDADETLPYPRKFLCAYSRSKSLAEIAVLEANGDSDMATVALRPHLIWGPRDNHLVPRLIQQTLAHRLRQVGRGDNRVSMTYVENAAAAHLQAADLLTPDATHAGRAYFINEPESVNLWDWINQLLGLADLPPVTATISAAAAHRLGTLLEATWRLFRLKGEPPMTRFLAAQLSRSHSYSIAAATRDFGYRRIVPVDEGLRRLEPELKQLAASG